MIRRTLLEWNSLPYSDALDDQNSIPQWAADQIAVVAKASPLGGEGGTRVLQHGRHAIRAGQVVGVIAAKDCSLEILPKIDGLEANAGQLRANLVHMLAVALNLEISPGALAQLGWQRENLLEILIKLFVEKLFAEVHRGLPRRYVAEQADLSALRGRLDVMRQFRALAASPQRLACSFDELSPDIALTQIMKAAVLRLLAVSRSSENQRRLRELSFAFLDISDVPVRALRWDAVVLDRTNSRWQALLNLARLLLGERFQTTSSGSAQGFSLLFEMNTLFEEYVGRELQRVLRPKGFSVHLQGGRLYCLHELEFETGKRGPQRFMTKPDIIVRYQGSPVAIVDTKWKRLGLRIDDPKLGISQSDVYQMMAYGRIYECPNLMLLYPHHDRLKQSSGLINHYAVQGCNDLLVTATVALDNLKSLPASLDHLTTQFLGLDGSGWAATA